MTYKFFKSKIYSCLKDGNNCFEEQDIQDLYTEYKKYWHCKKYTVIEFIKFWFQDWTIDNNDTELLDKYK